MSKTSRGIRAKRRDKYASQWPSPKGKAPSRAWDRASESDHHAVLNPSRRGCTLPA